MFDPCNCVKVNPVGINDCLQCCKGLGFCHQVGQVDVAVDLLDLSNFSLLVQLAVTHNVNHQSFLLSDTEFNKAIIEGF